MTCIIAGFDEPRKKTFMLADSEFSSDSLRDSSLTSKIIAVNVGRVNEFCLGVSGSVRVLNIINALTFDPKINFDVTNFEKVFHNGILQPIKKALEDEKLLNIDNEPTMENTSILFMGGHHIIQIQEDFGYFEPCREFTAIGNGGVLAIGVMLYALKYDKDLSIYDAAQRAINVASEVCTGISPPFSYLEIKKFTKKRA